MVVLKRKEMSREDAGDDRRDESRTLKHNQTAEFYPKHEEGGDPKIWAILLFGLIGVTVTTAAVSSQLRRSIDCAYSQTTRSTSSRYSSTGHSSSTTSHEAAWRRRNRQLQEEMEKEMERVELLRRMQSVFNREKNKYKQSYENWSKNSSGTSFREHDTYFKEPPRSARKYGLSHHYSVLGLDRWRNKPYTDDEIKSAFRVKAKEFHPDQNQGNKEAAEAKFKEIMASYEAIKSESKDKKCL